MPEAEGFEIVDGEGGGKILVNSHIVVAVLPEGTESLRAFKRNAIKNVGRVDSYKEIWAVGEINGVRCYVVEKDGMVRVVLTTQDLYP